MTVRERVSLAPFTSLGVGGPARFFAEAHSLADVKEACLFAKREGLPLRILGAGTNVLVQDEGIEALVVRFAARSCSLAPYAHGVLLTSDAGALWEDAVRRAAGEGLWGVENLAGIPGTVGGALVQNIGAYGAELSQVFAFAEAFDTKKGEMLRINGQDAMLGYRASIFKEQHELAILRVALMLTPEGAPNTAYADLARAKAAGTALTTPEEIAACVRGIRKEKFPAEGCAGSFFKNPVVAGEVLASLIARYPALPTYPAGEGTKVSLAWLLDNALGLRGYTKGLVRLYERQPIVLVTSAGASAREVKAFAREIETRVRNALGIVIEREVETFA